MTTLTNTQTISTHTTATQARQRLGLSPEAAARRLRVSVRYLRSIERNGNAPYALAERAARLYQCPMHTFLYPTTTE